MYRLDAERTYAHDARTGVLALCAGHCWQRPGWHYFSAGSPRERAQFSIADLLLIPFFARLPQRATC